MPRSLTMSVEEGTDDLVYTPGRLSNLILNLEQPAFAGSRGA
ncbi:MAG TPA: hypothetical protein VN960_09385 [Gaiellaceae bacterium]|jgi:hypothetical protein|nr:hypothetical protein [Gaiellaceae bacterium]